MTFDFENDPFVCPECRKAGYCIEKAKRVAAAIKRDATPQIADIIKHIPIRTTIKDASTTFGKKLQQAHDLFHQDEFEQASYMYADMLQSRNDCEEISIGLAACFYFLKKYEEAATIVQKFNKWNYSDFCDRLIALCEIEIKAEKKLKIDNEIETKDELCVSENRKY